MNADYEYTTIPKLIRDALGGEVDISEEYNGHFGIHGNNFDVDVMRIFNADVFVALQVKIKVNVNGKRKTFTCADYFAPSLGPNPEGFADAYKRLLVKLKPHQAAIDAHTEQLDQQAGVKAQRERYADSGPDLVAACYEAYNWMFDPLPDEPLKAMLKVLKDAISKTNLEDEE